ncbi:MAG: class I SAM-dependent methyltransferase [Oscillospiraceae bacterium]|jgi:O-methyltransferase involved in polyketide biosynthesis|nr:class I SAM-dependent methyltransferase [Oscillospiraceae bacterium]
MKKKIKLIGVNETMLTPVFARTVESKRKNPAFYDRMAVKIVDTLDYDFQKCNQKMNIWGVCARTIILDHLASQFITKNPHCTVVNLGCGLDDRFSRVDNGKIEWYNIEFPAVMEIRNQVIDRHKRVHNIASSVLDFQWIEQIKRKENVLVIAEGLLMYLSEQEIKQLFHNMAEGFKDVTALCELMSKWMVDKQTIHPTIQQTGAVFRYGIKHTEDFTNTCREYQMLADHNLTNTVKRYSPVLITLLSPLLRSKNNRIGVFKKMNQAKA